MSSTKKAVLIITGVAVVCLIGIGIVFAVYASGGRSALDFFMFFSGKSVTIDETQALDLEGVTGVSVESPSGRVTVMPGDAPKVSAVGSLWTRETKDRYLSVSESGGRLTIKFDFDSSYFAWADVDITVILPADFGHDLNVVCASADTAVRELSLNDVSVSCASGKTTVSGCTGAALEIGSASGGVSVTDSAFENIRATCQSGNIDIRNSQGDTTVQCTSGRVTVADMKGALDIRNTSGGVTVELPQKEIGPIRIDVTSGSVTMRLNANAAFDLDAGATSGGIRCEFDRLVSGGSSGSVAGDHISGAVNGGGVSVFIRTISGDIDIKKQ